MPLPDVQHRLSFPGLDGLYAWIEVEGARLQVYGVGQDGKKTIAYVEAMDGKQFTVHYLDLRSTCATSHVVRLYVDGSRVNGLVVEPEDSMFQDPPDDGSRECTFEGSEYTRASIRPFEFNPLQLTDNDDLACSDERVVKNIGTIQLKYMRVKNLRSTDTFKPKAGQMPSIHEKAKKAQLSHQVGFGEPVDEPAAPCLAYDWFDRDDDPLSMVEFRYRSRDMLQLQGYIEASPPAELPPSLAVKERSASPDIPPAPARGFASTSSSADDELSSKAARLAKLRRRYEELEREKEMAQLRDEMAAIKVQDEEAGVLAPADASRLKREREPRVKVEEGMRQSAGTEGTEGAKSGTETLVLSDSE